MEIRLGTQPKEYFVHQVKTSTIKVLSDLIRKREISPVDIVKELLDWSNQLDPILNIWASMDAEKVLSQAKHHESEISSGIYRGFMHGIPVGIKDIYDVQGMITSCGSPIYSNFFPQDDSRVTKLLRSAGAIIMGKTVTTQFACGDPPSTKNPWDHLRTPGGSSSGSAVGVAANIFPAALGSQTAGSVLRPAAYNGITGFKPTYGIVSRQGLFPVAPSLDTVGWFCRSVEDVQILLNLFTEVGKTDEDTYTNRDFTDYHPRIGVLEQFYKGECSQDSTENIERICDQFSSAGASIAIAHTDIDLHNAVEEHRTIMASEVAHIHEKDFANSPDLYKPQVKDLIETGLKIRSTQYLRAKSIQNELIAALKSTTTKFDAILTPTAMSTAPDTKTTGQPSFQIPWTMAGMPAISLPSGVNDQGLPLGIQLSGEKLRDQTLLSIAQWCEGIINFTDRPEISI